MDSRLGAWQVGDDANASAVEFKVYFPAGPDPHITSLQVTGTFQLQLGQAYWDWTAAPALVKGPHPEGTLWTYTTPVQLNAGFYDRRLTRCRFETTSFDVRSEGEHRRCEKSS